MEVGLGVGAKIDDVDDLVRADELGYSLAWFGTFAVHL